MNNYLAYGNNTNANGLINHHDYVFISAFGEFVGTTIFIFSLIATIANLSLPKSKAYTQKSFGWIVIGIAIGLLIALFCAYGMQIGLFKAINQGLTNQQINQLVQLNFNPAIVISSILKGTNYLHTSYIPIVNGLIYLLFELFGTISGAFLSYLFFKRLMLNEQNKIIQSCFYTSPSINHKIANFFNEAFATFTFVLAIIGLIISINDDMFITRIILIGIVIMGMGYGIGGVTGYALNPFRDFGPRLTYWLIFHKHAQTVDWKYALIPLTAPVIGSILATLIMPGWLY